MLSIQNKTFTAVAKNQFYLWCYTSWSRPTYRKGKKPHITFYKQNDFTILNFNILINVHDLSRKLYFTYRSYKHHNFVHKRLHL